MKDVIIILGVIIGILLIKTGKMKERYKLRTIGALIIAACLIVVAPDAIMAAIRGFMDGVNSAR